ncbi:DUF4292 domain-containing protein [Flavobacterium luminosum]|uniref:DUF4292 domain-containing protein n=1 Tax=Flavobacterium luminosum TaxID=2949086 RepID=A0ABT0TQY3_9FLAO|nr:DUF4292 domain-containing protein [Flavobacterium sp. HXWNR70]MCL9809898.1 DUF4292 domain-containing protein [Flavobacterium sp. HXWNR70]
MQKILPLLLLVLVVACKPKQNLVTPATVTNTAAVETVKNIISNHYAINRGFKTAFINANVDYVSPKQSLRVSADIRIKKDEMILLTVKFFGITGAKALITPTQVKYYEKANNTYFEGDYKMLSDWLGTELDFKKVQNMLIGQAIDDLDQTKYEMTTEENAPRLNEITSGNFLKGFVFYPDSFNLKKQEIQQLSPERKMLVNYSNYKSFAESVLPQELAIFATQNNQTTSIAIEYRDAKFNDELNFVYNVPRGYEQITIK